MSHQAIDNYQGKENLEIMTQARNYNRFLVRLILDISGPSNASIVDFGAGSGTIAKLVREAGKNIVCIEPDNKMRGHLKADGFAAKSSLKGLEDRSQNFIYSLNVLEHIEDDRATLADLYEKLDAGAVLFIYVPAFNILYSAMDEAVGHFRRYRKNDLTEKMETAGFKIIRSEYADSLGFAASLLFKYLFKKNDGTINVKHLKLYDRYIFPVSRFLDKFVRSFVGKNLLIVAIKP